MTGPAPATHTGICPICRTRQSVRPTTGTLWHHGGGLLQDCPGWRQQPVAGSLTPRRRTTRLSEAHWDSIRISAHLGGWVEARELRLTPAQSDAIVDAALTEVRRILEGP